MSEDTAGVEILQDVRQDAISLLEEVAAELDVSIVQDIGGFHMKKLKKDRMSILFRNALSSLYELTSLITTDFKTAASCVKTQMFESQQKIIELQSELLASKNEQLDSLKASVTSSVQKTVETEFKTYSSAVVQGQDQKQALVPGNLKTVVKEVVEQEDRSRNIMVFGLPEEADEQLNDKVSAVFGAIGEKPRIEASRLGRSGSGTKDRPVKVSLSSSVTVRQILRKARNLKTNDKFKMIFINPVLSPDERAKQRQLVLELKKLVKEQPGSKHFIRDGQVISVDKTTS